MIFDTHAHYCDSQFDDDRTSLLESMKSNNIQYITEICANIKDVNKIISLTQKYDFMSCALGVHPSEVADLTEADMLLIKDTYLNKNNKVVAIGEIGLDYHFDDDPEPDIQKKWFVRQLELAKELTLPIVIHSRDAAKDTFDILKSNGGAPNSGVIHCYSYSAEMAKDFIDLNFYIGIGGVVTFKNAKKLKEVVDAIPLEKIVLETDCPYMAPTPHRGTRNSSLYLPLVVDEIANIKGVSPKEVENITMKNALDMYKLS